MKLSWAYMRDKGGDGSGDLGEGAKAAAVRGTWGWWWEQCKRIVGGTKTKASGGAGGINGGNAGGGWAGVVWGTGAAMVLAIVVARAVALWAEGLEKEGAESNDKTEAENTNAQAKPVKVDQPSEEGTDPSPAESQKPGKIINGSDMC